MMACVAKVRNQVRRSGSSCCAMPPRSADVYERQAQKREPRLAPIIGKPSAPMNQLASAYLDAGNQERAVKVAGALVKRSQAALGPDQPSTLAAMVSLARIYASFWNLSKAQAQLDDALSRSRATLGPDHPETLRILIELAHSFENAQNADRARSLYEELLALQRAKLGADHPDALTTMDWMANSEWNAGKRDAALRLYEDRLKLQQRRLGPKHVDTVRSANALVRRYSAAGQLPRAVALLGELYASDPKNTLLLLQLASLQAWLGRHADLAATCRLAVANVNGAESPTEPERVAKACCLRAVIRPIPLGRGARARPRTVELGKGNAYLPYFQMALGMALFRSGHDADAERTLFAAWDRTATTTVTSPARRRSTARCACSI